MTEQYIDPMHTALDRLLTLAGESEARRIVRETGRRSAQAELERLIARQFAVRLLEQRAPRSLIRDRLVSRGINWRTAYRVIDAALDARRPVCANETPAMANEARTIEASQLPEHPMPLTLKDLHTTLQELKRRLALVDVDRARERAEMARAEYERLHGEMPARLRDGKSNPDDVIGGHGTAATTMRQRLHEAETAERDRRQLQAEIDQLTNMLNGEKRVAQAEEALASVQAMVESAEEQVKASESALATIGSLIQSEDRVYETARNDAAALLLAAVKAGGDTSTVPAATRDRLDTLEVAKVGAQEELNAARAALQAAIARKADAVHDLNVAQADVTALAHQVALSVYVEAAGAHMAAHARAHKQIFSEPDPREKAGEIARAVLAAAGL